jgi:hypothetical protein
MKTLWVLLMLIPFAFALDIQQSSDGCIGVGGVCYGSRFGYTGTFAPASGVYSFRYGNFQVTTPIAYQDQNRQTIQLLQNTTDLVSYEINPNIMGNYELGRYTAILIPKQIRGINNYGIRSYNDNYFEQIHTEKIYANAIEMPSSQFDCPNVQYLKGVKFLTNGKVSGTCANLPKMNCLSVVE